MIAKLIHVNRRLGWPWWALLPQAVLAAAAVIPLIIVDQALQVFFTMSSAPTANTPRESDSGVLFLVLILPILAIFFAAMMIPLVLTVGCAVIAGLPVRLNARLRGWWAQRWWLSLGITATGLATAATALALYGGRTRASETLFYLPSTPLFGISLLLTAFGLAHFWITRKPAPERTSDARA